jgi:tRNA1Val (adenine37-N6)-methyltransferase
MANNYFKFKKFTVYQNACAMKVSTDACLLGAMANAAVAPQRILDIGSGTGVLSLMLAQKYPNAKIAALEIDAAAATQASENVAKSLFANQIEVQCGNILEYKAQHLVDFIISNPPYFEQDLQTNIAALNVAKHSTELTLEQLAISISLLLHSRGAFCVIIPYHRVAYFLSVLSKVGLCAYSQVNVRHLESKPFLTSIMHGSFGAQRSLAASSFTLKKDNTNYTQEALDLLSPFYLHL